MATDAESASNAAGLDEEQYKLLAAVESAGISNTADALPARHLLRDLESFEPETPAELLLAAIMELGLEVGSNFLMLAPLFSFSQPFSLLKSRWQYREVEIIPRPKIEEVDDDGNVIESKKARLPAISWRKIRKDEGSWGLWRGWGCRVLHETLWRALTVTGWELLLYAPGNGSKAVIAKLLMSMTASALLVHPLHVLETRISAGMSGYGPRGVTGGLVRLLREDDVLQGLGASMAWALAYGPARLGYFSSAGAAAWSLGLYPLQRWAALQRLKVPRRTPETREILTAGI